MALRSFVSTVADLRHNALFKRLSLYGTSAGASQAIMMVYGILVARQLAPDGYGLFAANYAIAGVTIFLVNFGMDTWMLREAGSRHGPERLSGVVLQTKLTMGIVWALLLVGIAPVFRPDLFPRVLLAIVVIDQLCDSLLNTFVSGLNIATRTVHASRVLLITRVGRLITALVLIFILQSQNPMDYAVLRLSATVLGNYLGWLFLRPAWSGVGFAVPAKTLRASASFLLPELLALVYAQIDVSLLGFLTTIEEVGEYSPAVGLINAITVVPASIFYILVPILTNIFLNTPKRFPGAVRQMGFIYLGTGLFLASITALVLSPTISILLGARYINTGQLVLLMSPILLLKSLSFAGATYLVVVGKQVKRVWVQLVSAILNVGLNFVVIPVYGSFGAGVVYLISELVLAAGYLIMALYYYRSFLNSGSQEFQQR